MSRYIVTEQWLWEDGSAEVSVRVEYYGPFEDQEQAYDYAYKKSLSTTKKDCAVRILNEADDD